MNVQILGLEEVAKIKCNDKGSYLEASLKLPTGQQRCSSQRMHICDNLKFLNPTILIRFAL